ncbi:hypothetical protein CVM39_02900 [Pseudooceanicola antarcticus]|uniref:Uncharacterized protein n=1 Tax=Pseudooceanicola antarcticus TaxID=1247613 RepID=A0ABX4MXC6_9RHOB|nr:hypothetical protein CVM39_02900 [Pseudooceanicola antarcticus]
MPLALRLSEFRPFSEAARGLSAPEPPLLALPLLPELPPLPPELPPELPLSPELPPLALSLLA